ncbi:GNAT family N-acetyltransferase [Octadecabacter sp. G9-8]|uniref:GNAT family N-acetyltransferase n=1 Tax=Octadecabacter dasysiphoniae TaxID=2909341 RepID=A0ABS9CZZ9_9RHOB|nr:GNAT family N-acetyltransferase [Octadecabacter dasysiphoniae]MCF2872758.1 GNAT family N-acetyltransferase [Octadecabacter dasysiphoniae]
MTIRLTQHSDIPALCDIADTTLFPGEMLTGMVTPVLDGLSDAVWLTALDGETPRGFCFAAPEDMSNGTWNMRALAVAPEAHRHGFGRKLVATLEQKLGESGARVLVVDTASDPEQAPARAFYHSLGYTHAGTIPAFWDVGSDKVTFWKALPG